MKTPIAFVSESNVESQQDWLEHLRAVLPDENIVAFHDLTTSERDQVDLAIVADPDPAKLAKLSKLQWVQSLWAGVEKMMRQLRDAPFEIVRLEDPEMARAMAEAVVAWTLYLHRDMPAYIAQQRQKIWLEREHKRAGGAHIGFVGLGHLGQEAARALRHQHFEVSGWSRSQKELGGITTYHGADGLTAMLAQVDIVICLIPVTAETIGLMNAKRFAEMKDGASIINFARGAIVETQALLEALDKGKLRHAVLDVFDEEPLPQTSPLWTHPSVTVLPHISGPTNKETASEIVAENIKEYRATGTIPRVVSKDRGY